MRRLLIVDDELPMRLLLVDLFTEAGYHVLAAADGRAALAQVEQERPDLVLADIMMPVLDGAAFCRQLKAAPSTAAIPVILLTVGDRAPGLAAGADAVLRKPFNLTDLEQVVQRWLPPVRPAD
jgi:CheY-like chemotaxis protein